MNNQEKSFPTALPRTRRGVIAAGAFALAGVSLRRKTWALGDDGISNSAESIHQEPTFQADPRRIYQILLDAKQFDQIVRLGAATQSGSISGAPVEISGQVGGAFKLFGGYITGRHLELVPNERIVQAWRVESWAAGEYSIVRFKLVEQGSGTKIIFDHKAFPAGLGQHLASGWKGNYWEPMEKYLARK